MKKFNIFVFAIVALMGCVITSCKDDETNLSRAVLTSVSNLDFTSEPGEYGQMFTVTSDGDWVSEAPEWITVTPATGHAGQTEVTVYAAPNYRDNAEDKPRTTEVIFKGRNIWSVTKVKVSQGGDKFRDLEDMTLNQALTVDNGTVVSVKGLTVVLNGGKGLVATDGNSFVYIKNPVLPVTVGQKFNLQGEKATDNMKFSFLNGERMTDAGIGTVPTLTAVDITDNLDKTKYNTLTFVSVTGSFDGSVISVEGQNCGVYPEDASSELKLNKLAGHKIQMTGFYAGTAAPVIKVIPSEVVDLGAEGEETNEEVYFFDDFEYLEPWSALGNENGAKPAADIVGSDMKSTTQPQITSEKCLIEGRTAEQELKERGYDFLRWHAAGEPDGDCIYIQRNYLKFGKGKYQGGVVLPKLQSLEGKVEGISLSMDLCTQRQGSGTFDPTELVVVLETGGEKTEYEVPSFALPDNSQMAWTNIKIEFKGKSLDKDSKITIRNADSQLKSTKTYRWHLDNVKLSKLIK